MRNTQNHNDVLVLECQCKVKKKSIIVTFIYPCVSGLTVVTLMTVEFFYIPVLTDFSSLLTARKVARKYAKL